MLDYTTKILVTSIVIFCYYYWFKLLVKKPSYYLAKILKITKKHSVEEACGAIAFIVTTITHIIFACVLCLALSIPTKQLDMMNFSLKYFISSIFLGIGMAGSSALIVMLTIKLLTHYTAISEQNIFLGLSSGWLKRYEYIKSIFPIAISYPLIVIQLSCEEIVFRGVILNYLLSTGVSVAIFTSTILFAIMQTFHMPKLRGAIFPTIGALIMGPTHAYLYYIYHSIWPLIVSHTAFFLFFTL